MGGHCFVPLCCLPVPEEQQRVSKAMLSSDHWGLETSSDQDDDM